MLYSSIAVIEKIQMLSKNVKEIKVRKLARLVRKSILLPWLIGIN
jgi:hypothetical protein